MLKHNKSHENNDGFKEEIKGSPGETPIENSENPQPETGEESSAPKGQEPAHAQEATEGGDPTEAQGPDLRSGEQKYAMLEEKLAELNDQYLRKAADFENFRKRTMREKQELIDFANQNLLLDLLPVIDDFERAIKSAQSSLAAQTSKDFSSFYEGITMIEKRLSSQLENKWGLKRFESVGQPFDPNRHEALQVEKAAGVEEPFVEEDYLKGYTLKDKVIRFAKVKVRMPEEG